MPAPIITFYSYKGGTGRSMGLANIAWILASNGYRVLAVDWDLEAPGLHRYFRPFLLDQDLQSSPGVIDLMWEYATATMDPLGPDGSGWHERLADIRPYATSLEYPFPGDGTVDFVPAGRQDRLYPSLVSTFDWNNFYERLGGGGFLEALKRSMRENYDYVLVDSRTGLSDTAGICTVQLPDVLVNCFTLSNQAIDGAAAVAESVHRQRADSIRIFPVPMRVEDGEQDRLDAGRDYSRRRLGRYLFHVEDPDRYWGAVEVPYKGYYAYEEILATIGDRPLLDTTVLASMERVVGYLTDRRVTRLGGQLPESERRRLVAMFRHATATDADRAVVAALEPAVFIVYDHDSPERFDTVRHLWFLLREHGVNATMDRPPGQRRDDWPAWRTAQVDRARVVIVVGSAAAPPRAAVLRVALPPDRPPRDGGAVAVESVTAEGITPLVRELTTRLGRAVEQKPEASVWPRALRWYRGFAAVMVVLLAAAGLVALVSTTDQSRAGRVGWAVAGVLIGTLVALVVRAVLRRTVSRLIDQFAESLDLAIGRRLSRYGAQYRRWISSSFRFLDTKGLATVGSYTPRVDDVFIDLALLPRPAHHVPSGLLAAAEPEPPVRTSIWDLLQRDRPMVLAVIGGPGSGKTTLLRSVARQLADRPGRRRSWPIYCQLRDVGPLVMHDPDIMLPDVLRQLLPSLGVAEPTGWWERQLTQGRCVVLLDGLDETPPAGRPLLTAWIEQQVAIYPGNDFVITARPHGYRAASVSQATVVQVSPLSADQVRRFVGNWYRAMELRASGEAGADVDARARDGAEDLLARLAAAPALRELTVSPLLLTMIANVHRFRAALPGSRADLYGEIVQVLLWRRAEVKRLDLLLSGPVKERLLAGLAFDMMRRRVTNLRGREILAHFEAGLRRINEPVTAADVLADITSNGLLVEREADLFAFAHLTFQEFLAARHLRETRDDDVLTMTVDDPWWREIALFAAAGGDATSIVESCLASGSATALGLAFDCAEVAHELEPALRRELTLLIDDVFAPDAQPDRRRVVAVALATRHDRRSTPLPSGLRLTPPVPAALYRLFQLDTGREGPDDHDEIRPVLVGGPDALAYADWAATLRDGDARLPTAAELDGAELRGAAVWTYEQDGHSDPRLSGADDHGDGLGVIVLVLL